MFADKSRHMFWDCLERFWSQVANTVTDLLEVFIPSLPHILLLNDDWWSYNKKIADFKVETSSYTLY